MRKERILAVIMSVFMMLSMLPTAIYASEVIVIDGKLKIQGIPAEKSVLSADFEEVRPEGLTEDDVTYLWSRKTVEDEEAEEAGEIPELKELGKEKIYTVTEEDIGSKIVLTVTAKEESGFSGSLEVVSEEIMDLETAIAKLEEGLLNEEMILDIPEGIDTSTDQAGQESDADEVLPSDTDDVYQEEFTEYEITEETDAVQTPTEETEAGSESIDGIPEATEDGTYIDTDPQETSDTQDAESPQDAADLQESADQQENDGPQDIADAQDDSEADEITETEDTAENSAEAMIDSGSEELIDFGTIVSGQEEFTEEQYVTIVNTGNTTLNFGEIRPDHFAVEDIEDPLEPGESVTLWIVPRAGTEAGSYEDMITYTSSEGAVVTYQARMTVQAISETEQEVEEPVQEPITTQIPEETPIPEEAPTSEETPTPEPTQTMSDVSADSTEMNFESVLEGYTSEQLSQTVALTNAGTADAILSEAVSSAADESEKYFDIEWEAQTISKDGGQAVLTIRPKAGLQARTDVYTESFSITEQETQKTITITASITVNAVCHSLAISSSSELNFASAKKGYSEVASQSVTVVNNGNVTETLVQPSASSFTINAVDASALTLEPGGSVTFYVQPKAGLDVNSYQETIKVSSSATEVSFTAAFQVVKGTVSLTGIQQPSAISGLTNGTRKDKTSLKLPSTVVIQTTDGNMKASVSWNVSDCAYKQSSTEAQKFTVTGTVSLPSGVDNDNNLSLAASVEVSVNASDPKTASPDQNTITGIEYNGEYTTQSRISFTAVGAGMDNNSPKKGDTRFVPQNWSVINTNEWSKAPYTAAFGLAKSGDYTLKVTFKQQQYDGSTWNDTGTVDTRQVPFTVIKANVTVPGTDLTPAANKTNAVKTGDNTSILPFVILLIVAAGAVGGVVFYKKKK